jgi:hypothetical protein
LQKVSHRPPSPIVAVVGGVLVFAVFREAEDEEKDDYEEEFALYNPSERLL